MSTFDTLLTVFQLFDLSDTVLYYFYFCAVNWTCPGLWSLAAWFNTVSCKWKWKVKQRKGWKRKKIQQKLKMVVFVKVTGKIKLHFAEKKFESNTNRRLVDLKQIVQHLCINGLVFQLDTFYQNPWLQPCNKTWQENREQFVHRSQMHWHLLTTRG